LCVCLCGCVVVCVCVCLWVCGLVCVWVGGCVVWWVVGEGVVYADATVYCSSIFSADGYFPVVIDTSSKLPVLCICVLVTQNFRTARVV